MTSTRRITPGLVRRDDDDAARRRTSRRVALRPAPGLDRRRGRAVRRAAAVAGARSCPTSATSRSARSPPARWRWRSSPWPRASIVISGGIDLSVGSMMVFANCLSALWMEDQGLGACLALAVAVLAVTVALSTLTGLVITASGVPDIIVTLAASFVLAGLALFVIGGPGGGTSPRLPAPRRRRPVELVAVGAVDRRRARAGVAPAARAAGSAWRSTPSAATARRRSCPASRSPGPGCWPTRSAGCSPASPASSSRPRPAAASRARRSAPTPR